MSVLSYDPKNRASLNGTCCRIAGSCRINGDRLLAGSGWLGANSQLAALLIKSGAAIIDNMGLLFAVGVAFGLSKDKHGSAALSGLVGYYVVTTLLAPGGVAQLQHIDPSQVPAAFGKNQ